MKLLFTSAGLANGSITETFLDLIEKDIHHTNIAFIPTAANVESGDKSWLVKDLVALQNLKPLSLDIVDFSAVNRDIWQPRLEAADVLVFGGGNTFHLMHHLRNSGLAALLPKLLETRVYMGVSAGSMITGKKLFSQAERLYYDEIGTYEDEDGLGIVDFDIKPHLNSPHFPKVRDEYLKEMAKEFPEPMYALDDESAINVADGSVEIVSEGKWIRYN